MDAYATSIRGFRKIPRWFHSLSHLRDQEVRDPTNNPDARRALREWSFMPSTVTRSSVYFNLGARNATAGQGSSGMNFPSLPPKDGVTISCPTCGHAARETMPTDRFVFFYQCLGCGVILKPKPGDCCVFCSFGDRSCPLRQGAA